MTGRPQVGDEFAGYALVDHIGKGAMGSVFEARHRVLGRTAAIKFLDPELLTDQQYVARFLSEAKVVNAIKHPNIVDVYDFIERREDALVAYVMERIEGQTLSAHLDRRPLSFVVATELAIQLADALAAVHAAGVVHRDLKPANVVLTAESNSQPTGLKILDFGIAKIPNAPYQTEPGRVMGTPRYMAPEQLLGHGVGPPADVYALAELYFEMMSGHALFEGTENHVIRQKVMRIDPPELFFGTGVAEGEVVAALLRQCLHQDPAERPSAEAVKVTLESLLAAAATTEPGSETSTEVAEALTRRQRALAPTARQVPLVTLHATVARSAPVSDTLKTAPPVSTRTGWTELAPIIEGNRRLLFIGGAIAIVVAVVISLGTFTGQTEVVSMPLEVLPQNAAVGETPSVPPPPVVEAVSGTPAALDKAPRPKSRSKRPARASGKKSKPRPVKAVRPLSAEELPTW